MNNSAREISQLLKERAQMISELREIKEIYGVDGNGDCYSTGAISKDVMCAILDKYEG